LPTGSQHTHLMLTDTPNCNPTRRFVISQILLYF